VVPSKKGLWRPIRDNTVSGKKSSTVYETCGNDVPSRSWRKKKKITSLSDLVPMAVGKSSDEFVGASGTGVGVREETEHPCVHKWVLGWLPDTACSTWLEERLVGRDSGAVHGRIPLIWAFTPTLWIMSTGAGRTMNVSRSYLRTSSRYTRMETNVENHREHHQSRQR
jgi:hypothetical protein